MTAGDPPQPARRRVPASERRDALISAAVHEFAHGGLHGTPVDRIARRVGVAQPYVFSLFPEKRDLFLAAVARSFERVSAIFERVAADYEAGLLPGEDVFDAMGDAYLALLKSDRDLLMLQHQAYAACDDEVVREQVRSCYAQIIALVQRLGDGADPERVDEFIRGGMACNVAAAMGVEDLSVGCDWIRHELQRAQSPAAQQV